ncbi:ferrochelatase [Luteibacter jiangsuensis]|uniref:Ferrochelatase n=1 Tax=Luteibacter jiangsuensis TaxID=637577 RepID=A0ABT9SXE0_9GAMM|nr:ferrochelatase [Luteibacter jiangsuensis]MDQ0009674.1 ferrochelatase [Luteibacter jiangsuensis]
MPGTPNYTGLAGHSHDTPSQAAVLLVNLGTPDAPTAAAVRPYLAQFLGDPRVIEYPRLLWLAILHGVILRVRPKRSAHAYARIWTADGSPLRVGSEALATALQAELASRVAGPVRVALAMRYGKPDVASTIAALQREGVRRLLVLPLYPQYSATSTGSVFDAVADTVKGLRWPPELRQVNDYHGEASYIAALADSVRAHWAANGRGEKLLMSFHGIPERYLRAGDPYFCQCHATARLLREALGLSEDEAPISFQSRVGRERWLHPYTDETVKVFGGRGIKRIDVISPGFAVDCLETLEEIAMQNADFFREAGGDTLSYIPCLNATPAHVQALTDLVLRHGQGWPEFSPDYDGAAAAAHLAAARERARRIDGDA